jgi:hypothetical protein
MAIMDIKKNRENFELNLYDGSKKSFYNNILSRDHHRLAQIFLDLYMYGFPIEKAIKIFFKRLKKKDWLGF